MSKLCQYLHLANLASFYQETDELAPKLHGLGCQQQKTWPMGSVYTSLLKANKPNYSNYSLKCMIIWSVDVIMCISTVSNLFKTAV